MKFNYATAKKNPLIPTLYLGNLSYQITEEGLEKVLSRYGKVSYLYLVRDKKTKKSKGIAFAQYSKKDEFHYALKALSGKSFMGRTLKASQAIENETMPMKQTTKRKRLNSEEEITKDKLPKKRKKKGLNLLEEARKDTLIN